MEKKEIVIKKTAQHTAGTKYLERAKEGEINAPVYFQESKGKVEATIDDEAIGFVVGMKPEEMPGKYDCHITGLGEKANTFAASITMHPASGSSVSGKIATFSKEIEAAEKASGLSDVADRVQVMLDNRVKPCVIRATLGDYHKVENPHIPSALYKDTRNENEESILNQALMAAATQAALIFSGEKSTGKNVCAETVAYCRGESFSRINFEKDMLLEDVYGTKTTDNSAAEKLSLDLARGKVLADLTISEDTIPSDREADLIEQAAQFELYKAQSACIRLVQSQSDIIRWAKDGGVILYDEVNMANANILQTVMNSVADGEKTLIVPGVGNIKLNEHCVLLAGMNPGYAGTNDLNVATKSRCGFINFGFPKSIKPQLKANFKEGEINENYYDACEQLYAAFNAAVSSSKISADCLNIRGFVNALKVCAKFPDATSLATQLDIYVIAGCDEEERGVLETILHSKVRT